MYFSLLPEKDTSIRMDEVRTVIGNHIGDSSISFAFFNQNWEAIPTPLLDDERANILTSTKPPSPSAAEGKGAELLVNELKIESLEEDDMSPPSPPTTEDRKVSIEVDKGQWIE